MSLNPGRPGMRLLNNVDTFTAGPGDVVRIVSPGGGGRGDPLEREPERVLRDVVRGYVSPEAAEAEYGVVLRGGAVDAEATAALRASRRRDAAHPHFHFGAERERFERVWTRDAYDAMTAILTGLPVHWRHFVKGKLMDAVAEEGGGAPAVRAAWGRLATDLPQLRRFREAGPQA
jgi:N-methylhydantoinase B